MRLLIILCAGAVLLGQQAAFRLQIDTVPIYVTVTGPDGRLVTDLSRDDFQLLSDGKPVELKQFSNEVLPITAVLLLDLSSSMTSRMLWVREGATAFVEALQPVDRMRVASIGRELAISPHLTGNHDLLKRILRDELWPGGGTPLWIGIDKAMDSLQAESGRRVILALSDGIDTSARITAGEIVQRGVRDGFMVYALGIESKGLAADFRRVAEETGGGYAKVPPDVDLKETMVRIAEELRHQYVLAFSPPSLDGKTHELTVRMKQTALKARAQRRYLAAPRSPS